MHFKLLLGSGPLLPWFLTWWPDSTHSKNFMNVVGTYHTLPHLITLCHTLITSCQLSHTLPPSSHHATLPTHHTMPSFPHPPTLITPCHTSHSSRHALLPTPSHPHHTMPHFPLITPCHTSHTSHHALLPTSSHPHYTMPHTPSHHATHTITPCHTHHQIMPLPPTPIIPCHTLLFLFAAAQFAGSVTYMANAQDEIDKQIANVEGLLNQVGGA